MVQILQQSKGADSALVEQAIWCLGNLATDCQVYQYYLDVIPALVQVLATSKDVNMLSTTCFALSMFARAADATVVGLFYENAMLNNLGYILDHYEEEHELISEVGWTLTYISVVNSSEFFKEYLDEDLVSKALRLIPLLIKAHVVSPGKPTETGEVTHFHPVYSNVRRLAIPLFRFLANMLTFGFPFSSVQKTKIFKIVLETLECEDRALTKDSLWTLTNLCSLPNMSPPPKVIGALLHEIKSSDGTDVKKQACFVVSAIATHPSQITTLPNSELVPLLIDLLHTSDRELTKVCLEYLFHALTHSLVRNLQKNIQKHFRNLTFCKRN